MFEKENHLWHQREPHLTKWLDLWLDDLSLKTYRSLTYDSTFDTFELTFDSMTRTIVENFINYHNTTQQTKAHHMQTHHNTNTPHYERSKDRRQILIIKRKYRDRDNSEETTIATQNPQILPMTLVPIPIAEPYSLRSP